MIGQHQAEAAKVHHVGIVQPGARIRTLLNRQQPAGHSRGALALQTSFLTPPVGFSLFYLKGVVPPETKTRQIYLGVIPFILIQILAVAIVFIWEDLVLWLPKVMYG